MKPWREALSIRKSLKERPDWNVCTNSSVGMLLSRQDPRAERLHIEEPMVSLLLSSGLFSKLPVPPF